MAVSSVSGSNPYLSMYPTAQAGLASATGSSATSNNTTPSLGATTLSAIAETPSIASSTGSNWLDEADAALQSGGDSGGMMGALQTASQTTKPGSIASFLAQSQAEANALASIIQNAQSNAGQLYGQMAQENGQKAAAARYAQKQALLNPPQQQNFTPPMQLDPIVFYDDGSSLDTTNSILAESNGKQIDVTTGLEYTDPASILSMANGAYLNTKTNVLTESDGTKVDATTGLKLATTA
jgi:hypothetical protein